jgi:hypothetical protein
MNQLPSCKKQKTECEVARLINDDNINHSICRLSLTALPFAHHNRQFTPVEKSFEYKYGAKNTVDIASDDEDELDSNLASDKQQLLTLEENNGDEEKEFKEEKSDNESDDDDHLDSEIPIDEQQLLIQEEDNDNYEEEEEDSR